MPQQQKLAPFGQRMIGSLAGCFMGLMVGNIAVAVMNPVTPECTQLSERMRIEGRHNLTPDPSTGRLSEDQEKLSKCFNGSGSLFFALLPLALGIGGSVAGSRYMDRRHNEKNNNGPGPRR